MTHEVRNVALTRSYLIHHVKIHFLAARWHLAYETVRDAIMTTVRQATKRFVTLSDMHANRNDILHAITEKFGPIGVIDRCPCYCHEPLQFIGIMCEVCKRYHERLYGRHYDDGNEEEEEKAL